MSGARIDLNDASSDPPPPPPKRGRGLVLFVKNRSCRLNDACPSRLCAACFHPDDDPRRITAGPGRRPDLDSAAASRPQASDSPPADEAPAKPVVLLTCAGGIRSAGLAALVDALVAGGRYDVHVCAPESDKPTCGHSITIRETIKATSVDFTGAKAFEISGTPVDCVSLALSGRLFPWSAPALVISGINAGPNCGYEITM